MILKIKQNNKMFTHALVVLQSLNNCHQIHDLCPQVCSLVEAVDQEQAYTEHVVECNALHILKIQTNYKVN